MIIFKRDTINKTGVKVDNFMLEAIPEFKAIWRVEEALNNKELLYVFFLADVTKLNPLASLADVDIQQAHLEATKLCEMPSTWKPTEKTQQAVNAYRKIQLDLSPSTSILNNLKISIRQSNGLIVTLNKQAAAINKRVENMTKEYAKLCAIPSPNNAEQDRISALSIALNESNALAEESLSKVLALQDRLDNAFKRLDTLEEKVFSEIKANKKLVGNRELGNRELPNNHM